MKVYNTLRRSKEEFVPLEEGKVKMYVCGPTVYNFIHVGNARPMIVFDTLRRYFQYKGYDVTFVSNFTDIDDKIILKAKEAGVDFTEITEKYIDAYLEDSKALNFKEEDTIHPKATEYIEEMIEFVKGLEDKGAAYNVDGNVYFDISKAKNYGSLSKKNIDDLQAGARIDIADEKKNPMDFALWKKRKEESEPAWESPWGMGRPGWHLECSVMSKAILGDTMDIHAGGEDLEFPHHENEIAQSETLTGKPFARNWMHNSMITVDNEKMSKSKGNFFTIKDIAKHYDLEVLRLWLLSTHYRNPVNFSDEIMEQTKNGLDRIYNGKSYLERLIETADVSELQENEKELKEKIDSYRLSFEKAMDDDLNTADGLSAIYELVRFTNGHLKEINSKAIAEFALETLLKLSDVLGILYSRGEETLDEEIEKLIEERTQARLDKNYQRADEIRDQLDAMGIELKDTSTGVEWVKK